MSHHFRFPLLNKVLAIALFCIGVLLPLSASSALITLATAPLVNSSNSLVLPNLMYVLDNSGSMALDHLPDYVNDPNKCKSTAVSGTFSSNCSFGDPAYNLKDFNGVAYNPANTYLPALNSDGSSLPSMNSTQTSGWTNVPTDGYNIQNSDQLGNNVSSINFIADGSNTKGYPDRVWCNTSSATVADLSDSTKCNQNDQYVFPTSTFSNAYTFRTNPYYYTFNPTEYCTDKNLTSCQATTDATHQVPAILRWCDSAAHASYTNTTNTGCQAKYTDSTYSFAKWSSYGLDTGNGRIQILVDTVTNSAVPSTATPSNKLSVTNITVGGTRIIPSTPSPALTITDTTNPAQRAALATAIAANINSANITAAGSTYVATAVGDTVELNPSLANLSATLVVTTDTVSGSTVVPTKAVGSFQISIANAGSSISSIKVNGVEILGATINASGTKGSARRASLATGVINQINSFNSSPDYTATSDGASIPTITITAVNAGASGNGALTFTAPGVTIGTINNLSGGGSSTVSKTYKLPTKVSSFFGSVPIVANFNRVDIVPSNDNYPKAATRTDCAGSTCTYTEEMTNFANWYAYYRTRMQMMKSSTSLAFRDINTRFRVGFYTINNNPSSTYLPIATFDDTQKDAWYTSLFAIKPGNGTPLRSALTTVGRIFAGKNPLSKSPSDDPVQYSCQQNFTLLTTDGYWNTDTASAVKDIPGTGTVGDRDSDSTDKPRYQGPTASSETLADAAKYYYDNDLRTSTWSNCTGALGAGVDVCANNVFKSNDDTNEQQHMTTFTLGLGVDGVLNYDPGYKKQTSGDFVDLTNGTINWPVPVADKQTAVDDLWHAAVNGRGTYFSAKNPGQLADSLSATLNQINSKLGSGAAAATTTLQPVLASHTAFVSSYSTVKWTGNLESRDIDVVTGNTLPDAISCVEDVVPAACKTATILDTSVTPAIAYCPDTSKSSASCLLTIGNVYDTTLNACKIPVATSCSGALKTQVAVNTDSRNIYMNRGGTLVPFSKSNLQAASKDANFQASFLTSHLSQWATLTTGQQSQVTPDNLVSYLRGQIGYEDRQSNAVNNRIFRFREATLGDALDSTPAYNGVPKAQYVDPNYGPASASGTYLNTQTARDGTVYIGTNEGMLHAFDEDDMTERWAYVPSMVIPNMWQLADKSYAHANFVNGNPIINDVCVSACNTASAVWNTILVGGLNAGGQGYYAIDITDPVAPNLLWEFDTNSDSDLGYSFGDPIITKKSDGTWVVVLTSGYNNVGGGNPGHGILYVLNAKTGAIITKYDTGEGDATTPSGLAKINGFVQDSLKNNTSVNIYGGDLLGNLWRFDINLPQSATNPFKVAKLLGPAVLGVSPPQPITVKPELTTVNNGSLRMIIVGTGKYLESLDLSNLSVQTLYAITDLQLTDATTGNTTSTLVDPRISSNMVQQTFSDVSGKRVGTSNLVDFSNKRGWFVDFIDSGERESLAPQLSGGRVIATTAVPSSTVCAPGGYSWQYTLDFRSGAPVAAGGVVGKRYDTTLVGFNVLHLSNGDDVMQGSLSNGTTITDKVPPSLANSISGFQKNRIIWRELLDEQQ
jgi:type IV pilus assembly protein PilY1